MTIAAITTTIVMWAVFIGVLAWCFTRIGKGGKWED
jgi:hypothetical protein